MKTKMSKVFRSYATRVEMPMSSFSFRSKGRPIIEDHATPKSLGLSENDIIWSVETITIFVKQPAMYCFAFKVSMKTELTRVFDRFVRKVGMESYNYSFRRPNGGPIGYDATPKSLGLKDKDVISAWYTLHS